MEPTTTTSMVFVKRTSLPKIDKPYTLLYEPSDEFPLKNFAEERVYGIPIYDLRPKIETLSLDREGFVVVKLDSRLSYEDCWNEKLLRSVYAEELKAFLKSLLKARAIFIHECVIRQRAAVPAYLNNGYGQPVSIAHTDYTMDYVSKLIEQLFGDRATEIKDSRFQMINVWRPLYGPLQDYPLALCDLQSVSDDDYVQLDEVHAEDILESQLLLPNKDQKWFFLSNQEANELLIFKSVDSKIKGEVPHAAFSDPRYPNARPRESVEFRVLVAY